MNNPKIRYGIIGFGNFAERAIMPAIVQSPNSELIAIQKRSLDEANRKKEEYGIPLAFSSVSDLVRCTDIDAVYIVSANAAHAAETITAAAAKKHVLVEKPMAMNLTEAAAMTDACRKNGVKLMVAHMLRFSPLVLRIKELINTGAIGEVIFVRSEFVYDARISIRKWVFDMESAGGGPVVDIGVHCLDTVRFILDDTASAINAILSPKPTTKRTETSALISLQMRSGIPVSIFCSFGTGFRRTYLEIMGDRGMISVQNFTHNNTTVSLVITHGKNGRSQYQEIEEIDVPVMYVDQVTRFSNAILLDQPSPIPGEVGIENQRILDAVMKS